MTGLMIGRLPMRFEPGIYDNIPAADYHAADGLSSTMLRKFIERPALYKAAIDGNLPTIVSDAMNIGTAYHALMLEPEKFYYSIAVSPKFDRRTKQGKLDSEIFDSDNFGKTIIDEAEYLELRAMQTAFIAAELDKLIRGGKKEISLFWIHKDTWLLCKARLDYWRQGKYAIDLKSFSGLPSGENFAKDVANYGYHIQQEHYQDGIETLTAIRDPFYFVVQQKTAPYFAVAHQLGEEFTEIARIERGEAIQQLKECRASNNYPGYESQIIKPPYWLASKYKDLI